jgi:hypothetical protein
VGPFTDTVPPEPFLTIGEEGELDYEFFWIGEVGALASGNVVVANGGTHELRFYDSNGKFIRTVGRQGEGPAEFGFLSTFRMRPGDTIAVFDTRRRRIVLFDSAGTLVRGQSYAQDLTDQSPDGQYPCVFPGLMGVLADGTRVTSGWGCMSFQGTDGKRPSMLPVTLVRDGGKVPVQTFAASWVWERGGTDDLREQMSPIPFIGNLTYAVGPDRLYFSEGTEYEIKIFDGEGRLVGMLREDAVPPEVTDADRQAYVETQAETPRPYREDVPFPSRFGSYSALRLSHEGDLWAQRLTAPGDSLQYWVVFSPDGREVRRVVVPDIRVETIRDGLVYGHRSDSLGIQTVVVLDGRLGGPGQEDQGQGD